MKLSIIMPVYNEKNTVAKIIDIVRSVGPKHAPLNKYSQAHDCKNLFCVDGGPFVSQADKNPTWTILALSMRASEYIIDELKRKNL